MAENLPDTNVGNIEYISKQDAVKSIGEEYVPRTDFERGMVSQLSCDKEKIKALPAADVAPVVHSQWKYKCGEIQCPECGNRIHRIDLSGYLNYCPNCGARMDGEG